MNKPNPLDVTCPVCLVPADEPCIDLDANGPRASPHEARPLSARDAAITAERRRNEEDDVAERIADMLEAEAARVARRNHVDMVSSALYHYAAEIRAGKWRP